MAKITPEISYEIQKMMINNSCREIAEELNNKYSNLNISHVAINKHIVKLRKERAEVTKKIVQDYIQESLPSDLELLKRLLQDLQQMLQDDKLKPSERLSVMDRIDKIVNTRLKYSGAGEQDNEVVIKWNYGISETDIEVDIDGETDNN